MEDKEPLRILQGRLQPCYRKRASLALLLAVQRWNYRCYLTILVTKVPKIDSELVIRTREMSFLALDEIVFRGPNWKII